MSGKKSSNQIQQYINVNPVRINNSVLTPEYVICYKILFVAESKP